MIMTVFSLRKEDHHGILVQNFILTIPKLQNDIIFLWSLSLLIYTSLCISPIHSQVIEYAVCLHYEILK